MDAERIEIPLFPLGTVLFPGGALPLKIFERRYVEMTKRCLKDDTPFGVCLIREGAEVGTPAIPMTVGCTARIVDWELPHPNLFHLMTVGERRFRVLEAGADDLGLIVAAIELMPEPPAQSGPDPAFRRLVETLVQQVGADRFRGPIALDDAAWVGYRLAEALPVEALVKQRLLELPDPADREGVLRDILGAAGLG